MSDQKIFLQPVHMRRGQDVLNFVIREPNAGGTDHNYWLGTYYLLYPTPINSKIYHGDGRDYEAVQRVKISRHLYHEIRLESERNAEEYAQ